MQNAVALGRADNVLVLLLTFIFVKLINGSVALFLVGILELAVSTAHAPGVERADG
jgi:hypothetical protein